MATNNVNFILKLSIVLIKFSLLCSEFKETKSMDTSIKKKVNSKLDYILLNAKRAITAESTWPDKVIEIKYLKLI